MKPESQLFHRKILHLRQFFKNKSYATHKGALRAIGNVSDTISLNEPFIFRACQWSDNRFRLEIPLIKYRNEL